MTTSVYIDQGPSLDGTSLSANNLNTAVVAQGYIISGGVIEPGAGGTTPSVTLGLIGIDVMQPQTEAVVASGNSPAGYVLVPARIIALSLSADVNMDNYVDLFLQDMGAFYEGNYGVSAVEQGDPAPPQAPGTLRLYMANVASNGVIEDVDQLAPSIPVGLEMVSADQAEAQTHNALFPTSSLVTNLNRIRYQIGQLVGGAWDAAVQMIPLSQKGTASGVADLDSTARLRNAELPVNVSLAGTLSVAGATALGGSPFETGYTLSIGGSTILSGILSVIGAQTVTDYLGVASANTPGYVLDVGGDALFHDTTVFLDPVYADSGIYGNTGSTVLDLYGPTGITLHAPTTATSGLEVSAGTFNVSGVGAASLMNGPLTVTGLATFNGAFTGPGGTAQATGNMRVNGQVSVGAAPTGSDALRVVGTSYLNGTVTMSGLLVVPALDNTGSAVSVLNGLTVSGDLTPDGRLMPGGTTLAEPANLFLGSGQVLATVNFVGPYHTDLAGQVEFIPDSATTGPHFTIVFSTPTVHHANPIVFLTARGGGTQGAWYVTGQTQSEFSVSTNFNVTIGATYYISYLVLN